MGQRETAPDFPDELRTGQKNIAPRTEDIRLTNRGGPTDPRIRARTPRVLESLSKAREGYSVVRELMKKKPARNGTRGGKR